MAKSSTFTAHLRGPSDHDVRTQIVSAATDYFSHYGYEKTTVSDLAKSIGFSKAYIYKFFDSKQAIGEVICANTLSVIMHAVDDAMKDADSATERFRLAFSTVVEAGCELFFQDRKLYDIAATAASEPWPSVFSYEEHIKNLVLKILKEGRESGEFERKTPLDETINAIYLVLHPYINPLLLQHNLDQAMAATNQLSNLILRSLAP